MSPDDRTPARLVLLRPDGEGLVYVLDQGSAVTLGRDPANTIVLGSMFVSKRHAVVSWTPQGARIEDQDSANGVAINGITVQAAQLSPGDVIQIGDQHFVFEGERQPAVVPASDGVASARGPTRSRPVFVSVLAAIVAAGGLAAVYALLPKPAVKESAASSPAPREGGSVPSGTTITPFDSPQAQAIELQAAAAHDNRPVDWLFDEGQRAYENGRLLDAYRLLHGALLRDARHEASRRLLLRVMADRDQRLNSLQAAAARAGDQSKFDEAAQQWDAVQALTLDTEPLNARARTESARLRQRAAQ